MYIEVKDTKKQTVNYVFELDEHAFYDVLPQHTTVTKISHNYTFLETSISLCHYEVERAKLTNQ